MLALVTSAGIPSHVLFAAASLVLRAIIVEHLDII
jgi:hypothetical protein